MFIELTSAPNGNTVIVNCDRTAVTLCHHTIEVKEDVFEIAGIVARNNK